MARAALDKRIGQDHYDLPAILERLLLSATVGDFEGARADAQIFERLGFAAEANRVLSRIAKGDAPVTAVGRVYMVAPPDTVDVEAIGRIVTDACAALADHLGRAIKPVWIDFQDGPPYANVTRLELAGLARISLSRRLFQQSDWSSILWHEAAHATMFARSRFLDEGWAVWCQVRFAPETTFPTRVDRIDSFDVARDVVQMPLARLLDYSGRDLTFSDLVSDDHAWRSIYVRAYRLIATVESRIGGPGLAALFDRIAVGEPAGHALEMLCGASLDDLEATAGFQPVARTAEAPAASRVLPDLRKAREVLAHARITGETDALDQAIATLRAAGAAKAPTMRLLGLMLAERALAPARQGKAPASTILADLDETIARLRGAEDPAGAALLRAQKSVMSLLLAANPLGKAALSQNAQHLYENAQALGPDDADIALAFARFELGKPSFFRNVDHAVDLLRRATRDRSCIAEVDALIETFALSDRIEPSGEAGRPGGGQPDHQTADAPVAVRVGRIALSTGDGFELDIGGFDVARGSCIVVIGANGAGKTTLLEAMVGVRSAASADIDLLDRSLAQWTREPKSRRRFGVQTQTPSFPSDVTVAEIVRLHRALYGLAKARSDDLGIGELVRLRYGSLSRGQRQRVDLHVALAHDPEVAILDEPSAGLDAHYREVLARMMQERGDRTIIVASHDRRELEAATHILWMRAGRMVKFGTAGTVLRQSLGSFKAEAVLEGRGEAVAWMERITTCAPLRHSEIQDDGRVVMFSDVPLDPLLRGELSDVESYSFGRAGYADLVWASSKGLPHV